MATTKKTIPARNPNHVATPLDAVAAARQNLQHAHDALRTANRAQIDATSAAADASTALARAIEDAPRAIAGETV